MRAPGGGHTGIWPNTIGHEKTYFYDRGCFLDCRGGLVISGKSYWGMGVMVITESHEIGHWPNLGIINVRPVQVDDYAWIGSGCLLVSCHIGEGAIVAAGTVVRGQNVAPYTMVAGNPARVIARWDPGSHAWRYLENTGYERELV